MPSSRKSKTPRNYLSWSQMNLLERNPELYREVYFKNGKVPESEAMDFGRRVALALETGKSDEPVIQNALIFLPNYPKREYTIRAKYKGIPLLGKLDGYDPKNRVIGEVKTGKKWTQALVDKNDQLTFYALIDFLKYKRGRAKKILLHWLNTETAEIKTFETKRGLGDFHPMTVRIERSWKAINEMAREEAKI